MAHVVHFIHAGDTKGTHKYEEAEDGKIIDDPEVTGRVYIKKSFYKDRKGGPPERLRFTIEEE